MQNKPADKWEIPVDKLKIELPPDCHLKEDRNFIFLFYHDEPVAKFPIMGTDPADIEKRAREFIENKEWNKSRYGI